jgi:hypothetical protein
MDGQNFDRNTNSIEAVYDLLQSCYEYASVYSITRQVLFLRLGVIYIIFLHKHVLTQ